MQSLRHRAQSEFPRVPDLRGGNEKRECESYVGMGGGGSLAARGGEEGVWHDQGEGYEGRFVVHVDGVRAVGGQEE